MHGIHPYPCKFPPEVATVARVPGAVVVDPFSGSGTTLLEAARGGARAFGFDVNPIANLIANAKLIDSDDFGSMSEAVLAALMRDSRKFPDSEFALPDFPGRDHWFPPVLQVEYGAILRWLQEHCEKDGDIWNWLAVSLSALVVRFSYQDSETRYARRERTFKPGALAEAFVLKASDVRRRILDRGRLAGSGKAYTADATTRLPVANETVDLIVTSPPYANTMDYYLYHKQRMNILGFDFREAQRLEIGSRHEFSSRKASTGKWQTDLDLCVEEMARVLKPGGQATVIIGDSQIGGDLLDAASALMLAASRAGLKYRLMSSQPMAGQSRSFNRHFQRPNKYEHTVTLTKP